MTSDLILPVFPLPDVVLFPRVMLPLHIFEARYRKLVKDLLAKPEDERLIIVSNLEPKNLPVGKNPFASVGTVGKMIHVETIGDGRFNIVLHGQFTVEIQEVVPSPQPYRMCKINKIREEYWENPLGDRTTDKDKLFAAIHDFSNRTHVVIEDVDKIELDDLINGLAFSLSISGHDKQDLLEEPILNKRLDVLVDILESSGYYKELKPKKDYYKGVN